MQTFPRNSSIIPAALTFVNRQFGSDGFIHTLTLSLRSYSFFEGSGWYILSFHVKITYQRNSLTFMKGNIHLVRALNFPKN